MRPGAVVQARLGSRRLPGKVLADVAGRPLLGRVLDRVRRARRLAVAVVATTAEARDDAVADFCSAEGVPCFRGATDDVLARVLGAARAFDLDPVVRVTADCPFVCPELLDALVGALVDERADYVTAAEPTVHEGIDPFSRAALERLHALDLPAEEREHLALLAERHPDLVRVVRVPVMPPARPGLRLSVDEPADLSFARACVEALRHVEPFSTDDLLRLLDRRPELLDLRRASGRASGAPRAARAASDGPLPPAPSGAELLARALRERDIPRLHLYPGGTIMPTLEAWIELGGSYVVARHEQGAGYAALAEARLTREPRVVLVTSGPGLTNLVTVLADAFYDSTPLVAIAGQVGSADLRSRPSVRQRGFQEVPATTLCAPLTKACLRPMSAADVPRVVEEAFRVAAEGRPGPVLIDLPMDVQRSAVESRTPACGRASDAPPTRSGLDPARGCAAASPAPDPASGHASTPSVADPAPIELLADLLLEAERPVVLAGQGVLLSGATRALRELAERQGVPVAETLLGVGSIPGDHPLSLGYVGHTGAGWANRAVHECDLLLVLGARLDVRQTGTRTEAFVPRGRVARVDLDPCELREARIRSDLAIRADVRGALTALEARLRKRIAPSRETWLGRIKAWREALPLDAYPAGDGCHPARLLRAVDAASRGRPLVVVTGVGHHQQWTARHMTFDWPERVLLTSGGHGAMGYDLPSSVGAAWARPDARVCCVVGDGSFQINMQELGTIAEYRLPVKILVLDNRRLAMVSQFQNLTWGRDPSTGGRAAVDFAGIARSYGIETFRLDGWADDAPATVERFLQSSGPALLWARVDPACDVSPMLLAGQTMDEMWTWNGASEPR